MEVKKNNFFFKKGTSSFFAQIAEWSIFTDIFFILKRWELLIKEPLSVDGAGMGQFEVLGQVGSGRSRKNRWIGTEALKVRKPLGIKIAI